MTAVRLAEIPPYGLFREETEIVTISQAFLGFPRPWVGISTKGRSIVIAFADTAGTMWKSTFNDGWNTEIIYDDISTMYGPTGHWAGVGWASPPPGSTYELVYSDNTLLFVTTDPYAGTEIEKPLGMLTASMFPPEFYQSILGDVAWPPPPTPEFRPEASFLAVDVQRSPIGGPSHPALGDERLVAIIVYVKDTWKVTGSGVWGWGREYVVAKQEQMLFQSLFPPNPVVSTFWNGPGDPPGSAGVYLARTWNGGNVPYNEGGIRVWVGQETKISDYAMYLIPSDTPDYRDFQGILFPSPLQHLTWAYDPRSGLANVVHGIDSMGSLFSKYFDWNGNNYRVRLSGQMVGVQWIWTCPAHPHMIIAATAPVDNTPSRLIAITLPEPPGPPSEEIEPFYPSDLPYPEVPWLPPETVDPSIATINAHSVMRW